MYFVPQNASKVTRYIPIHRPSNVMLPVTSQPYTKKHPKNIFYPKYTTYTFSDLIICFIHA